MDDVRVLRVIEYSGPRDQVEAQVAKSIHGMRMFRDVTIRAATLGQYPEVLQVDERYLLPGIVGEADK